MKPRDKKVEEILSYYVKEFETMFSAGVIGDLDQIKTNMEKIACIQMCLNQITETINCSMETISHLNEYPVAALDQMIEEFKRVSRMKFN